MLPFLNIGPLLVNFSGLVTLAGIWIGLTLAEKESRRMNLNATQIGNSLLIGLGAGVIGARLGYALQHLEAYLTNPLSLFSILPDSFLPWAGLLTGCLAALVYGMRKGLPLRPSLDAMATGLAFFMLSQGVSHFLSGDAYGAPADLPWAILLWSEMRHPSQVYETLAATAIFALTWFSPNRRQGSGMSFLIVVAASAFAGIFLEAFRGDSQFLAGGFRTTQVAGLVVLAASLVLMRKWEPKTTGPGEPGPGQE